MVEEYDESEMVVPVASESPNPAKLKGTLQRGKGGTNRGSQISNELKQNSLTAKPSLTEHSIQSNVMQAQLVYQDKLPQIKPYGR